MALSIYVDGSGGPGGGYGYYVKESGESFYQEEPGITNNQAEYKAVIAALKKFSDTEDVVIYSDSRNTVSQLNHEFAINSPQLRDLAREAWEVIGRCRGVEIRWIPRKENLAGKMLGS